MPLTYDNLPVSPEYGQMLKCFICNAEWSASKGDYFMVDPATAPTCCDEPLLLVTRTITFEHFKMG